MGYRLNFRVIFTVIRSSCTNLLLSTRTLTDFWGLLRISAFTLEEQILGSWIRLDLSKSFSSTPHILVDVSLNTRGGQGAE